MANNSLYWPSSEVEPGDLVWIPAVVVAASENLTENGFTVKVEVVASDDTPSDLMTGMDEYWFYTLDQIKRRDV